MFIYFTFVTYLDSSLMFVGLSFSLITYVISFSFSRVTIPRPPRDIPLTSLNRKSSLFRNNSVYSDSADFFSHFGFRIIVSTYTMFVLIPNVSSNYPSYTCWTQNGEIRSIWRSSITKQSNSDSNETTDWESCVCPLRSLLRRVIIYALVLPFANLYFIGPKSFSIRLIDLITVTL